MTKASWRSTVVRVFAAGLLVTGLLGTSTAMTFVWPGYLLVGLAGVLSIGTLFHRVSFAAPGWGLVLVVGFAGYLVFRAGDSPVAYFGRVDAALVVVCLVGYLGFLSFCSDDRARRAVVLALAGFVAANLVFAGLQALVDPALWLIPGYERTFPDRVGGLFNRPDHFAGFVAATAPLWVSLSIFGKQGCRWRKVWIALAASSAGGVLLSGNLAGCLVLGAGMLSFGALAGWVARRRLDPAIVKRGMAAIAGVLALGAVGLLLAARPVSDQVAREIFVKRGDVSLPAAWEVGWKQAGESPWLGTGSRTSPLYARRFQGERPEEGAAPEFVHNEFLQLAAEYGGVGAGLLFATLAWHLVSGLRFVGAYAGAQPRPGHLAARSDRLALALGSAASLAAMGFLSGFDFAMHLPVFAVTASILLAILAVPDPMATALKSGSRPVIPGGISLFGARAVAIGCGLALLLVGSIFVRSEWHYERARLALEAGADEGRYLRHLESARALDPWNPHVFNLSARARVAGVEPGTAESERRRALEDADVHFEKARRLHPRDPAAAVDHAAVLDALGQRSRGRGRLREAREWAPGCGNLILAEAEHHLRHGEVAEAESSFREVLESGALRDREAAREGLRAVTEWRKIAERQGDSGGEAEPSPGKSDGEKSRLPEARVVERAVAGRGGGRKDASDVKSGEAAE